MRGLRVKIGLAFLFGIAMVFSAWWLQHSKVVSRVGGANIEAALGTAQDRRHIKVTDSDEDGVPDWQRNLIDGEPIYIDGTTTGQYVPPETIGGQFAIDFFEDTITLEVQGLLEETKEQFIEGAIKELEARTEEKLYTIDDLKNIITTTDTNALRAFGNLVAGTIFHYQTDEENELQVFERLVKDENPRHLEKLAKIEKQYENIIDALLVLEVPSQYTFEHLRVINALSALRETTYAMQLYFDDPIHTLVRYRQIHSDVLELNDAIVSLYDALYLDAKVQFAQNETLPVLVELLQ